MSVTFLQQLLLTCPFPGIDSDVTPGSYNMTRLLFLVDANSLKLDSIQILSHGVYEVQVIASLLTSEGGIHDNLDLQLVQYLFFFPK